jgi:hypothetical protein
MQGRKSVVPNEHLAFGTKQYRNNGENTYVTHTHSKIQVNARIVSNPSIYRSPYLFRTSWLDAFWASSYHIIRIIKLDFIRSRARITDEYNSAHVAFNDMVTKYLIRWK